MDRQSIFQIERNSTHFLLRCTGKQSALRRKKALVLTSELFCIFSCIFQAEKLTYKYSHNIGVAMDTAQGLLVPNIKGVQNLTVFEVNTIVAYKII